MIIENKLIRAIERSEKAYILYLENKIFLQALRIFRANLIVYDLLEDFVFECKEQCLSEVFLYLFHLEDWFESFEAARAVEPALDDMFVFASLPESLKFPLNFKENVLKKQV